ncbi:hypothetical protein F3I55_00490 [Pantoea sp. VH_24]|uniref:hypothetical protein n=1 Tax=Pantoea TaxID=53335 RepID=UPI0012328B54|nr:MULTISPECIES: hypothetical protein [Pantoea]KAA5960936.1 hypothetical protein F3I55_00490 [Pantoea sp. VH_24]KAA6111401.1 hypothetical protein F3I25_02745 [Pantoea sp. Bo_14]
MIKYNLLFNAHSRFVLLACKVRFLSRPNVSGGNKTTTQLPAFAHPSAIGSEVVSVFAAP